MGLMNWNYSSADFEDSLYEEVQGPDEGGETGSGRQIEVTRSMTVREDKIKTELQWEVIY